MGRVFARLFSVARTHGRAVGREFVREAAEDQFKEKVMGFKGNLYTGLPTRGGIFYNVFKELMKSTPSRDKVELVHELQGQGISSEGSEEIASGNDPRSQADLAILMRLVNKFGSDQLASTSANAKGSKGLGGEVYTAAMVSVNRADE